jgi:hypothetical protein
MSQRAAKTRKHASNTLADCSSLKQLSSIFEIASSSTGFTAATTSAALSAPIRSGRQRPGVPAVRPKKSP